MPWNPVWCRFLAESCSWLMLLKVGVEVSSPQIKEALGWVKKGKKGGVGINTTVQWIHLNVAWGLKGEKFPERWNCMVVQAVTSLRTVQPSFVQPFFFFFPSPGGQMEKAIYYIIHYLGYTLRLHRASFVELLGSN